MKCVKRYCVVSFFHRDKKENDDGGEDANVACAARKRRREFIGHMDDVSGWEWSLRYDGDKWPFYGDKNESWMPCHSGLLRSKGTYSVTKEKGVLPR